MLLACSLCACKGVEITGKTEDVDGYTLAESMIVLASERNRYQNVYTDRIWSLPVEGQQQDQFGPYFVERVKEFLQDVKTLNLLAAERGIIATSTEKNEIRQLSEAFYNGLTEEDILYMGSCTLKDVQNIYTEYFIACKTADYLLSGVDTEVSDADAKIIRVEQIMVTDREQADQLAQDVLLEGANFNYYARQYSETTEIERTLAKGEQENAYYDAAFALEQNQISGVIELDGAYYILKCIDAYDMDATLARKETLQQAIRTNAFMTNYNSYADQHIVRFRESFWREIDLSEMPESTASNFFSLYEEYMQGY